MAFFSSILGSSSESPHEVLKISLGLLSAYILYSIIVMIYRLTHHPLAKFPGPFLCRISWCYEIYYEAILGGKLLEQLPALHEKYGGLTFTRQPRSASILTMTCRTSYQDQSTRNTCQRPTAIPCVSSLLHNSMPSIWWLISIL